MLVAARKSIFSIRSSDKSRNFAHLASSAKCHDTEATNAVAPGRGAAHLVITYGPLRGLQLAQSAISV